jgi:pimeloyl-ACP methyl ester carboxylesterase
MPKVKVNDITINYEQQGSGEPLVLIPYLAADNACYAFQVADYAKHFTCISLDPRGAGETDKPEGTYSTELFADDVAGFMQAIGVERAHVSGVSLGGTIGLWLASKYPQKVKTLSLHSCWPKTDPFLKVVVGGWQAMAKGLGSVQEMVVQGILPFCLTPELYAAKPEYVDQLAAFVRSRPKQPFDAFLRPRSAWQDLGPDPDHLRPPRHRDLDPLRRAAQAWNQEHGTRRVRDQRPRSDLRKRERVQREDAGVPQPARGLRAAVNRAPIGAPAGEIKSTIVRVRNAAFGSGGDHSSAPRRLRQRWRPMSTHWPAVRRPGPACSPNSRPASR